MNISIKRILRDIKEINKNPLKNIILKYNDESLYNMKAMIIGQEDTPYYGGCFIFDIIFTDKYPFKPPEVKLLTTNKQTRFNPNLYSNGKICLSILNTWSGPKWTSIQTLSSILLSIQSLLHQNPLINEPGYENASAKLINNYNSVIKYHTYKYAIIEQYELCQHEMFKVEIENHIKNNIENLLIDIKNAKKNDNNKYIVFNFYDIYVKIKYKPLIKLLKKVLNQNLGDNLGDPC
jgi:ubiquitin-conjugating enzyme E2 Z